MLSAPRWWWRVGLALACGLSVGGLFAIIYSGDRFQTVRVGSTTIEIACVSGLLVFVPMRLRPLTIEERADEFDALDDAMAIALKAKRPIDAELLEASDEETPGLLAEAARLETQIDRLTTRWKNLIVPDSSARSAARQSIKDHLYKRTMPTRSGPVFESVPGFREQKAYIVVAWLPAIAFSLGLLPLVSAGLKWMRIRRRRLRGCCARCNYSLRGLSELRCPECGKGFERAVQ